MDIMLRLQTWEKRGGPLRRRPPAPPRLRHMTVIVLIAGVRSGPAGFETRSMTVYALPSPVVKMCVGSRSVDSGVPSPKSQTHELGRRSRCP